MFLISVNEPQPCELVDCGILVELLLLVGKATQRNKFDIYLNAFAGVGHLLVRPGLVGWLLLELAEAKPTF